MNASVIHARRPLARTVLVAVLLVSLSAGAFAQQGDKPGPTLSAEISSILKAQENTQIGTLTISDLEGMAGQISVAAQKEAYVARARMASHVLPGAGQFMTGDPVGGGLFVAADVAVFAGSLLTAYYLLPANVQIGGTGGLDYLNAPLATIETTWKSHSVLDYLPTVGVLAGGMIVKHLLGLWSSSSAADLARKNIQAGKVTFEPQILPFMNGRLPGMGMMMRFRY